jgi:ribosome biogenesis GTPase YqeH
MFFNKQKASSGLTAEIRIRRCFGCGAVLQDTNPKEPGYVPKDKFESSQDDLLCERCFKLRHYSSFSASPYFNNDYVTILKKAKEEKALAVYVLNAFALQGSFLKGLGRFLPEKVLVVINKSDLLPKNTNWEYLKAYVNKCLEEEGIKPLDIIVTSASATSTANLEALFADFEKFRDHKSVYLFGAYQVGKSSITNAFLLGYTNSTKKMITTSPYPGTTLDVISIPLDNASYLYDTPGLYNPDSLVCFLEPELVKYVLPRNTVRPEAYQSKAGQSFVFSNFGRFDHVGGSKTVFTFFKSNDLAISRCKIDKADKLIDANGRNDQLDIKTAKLNGHEDLVKTTLKAIPNVPNIVRISGLAFIEFIGTDQVIDVYAPKGITVVLEGNV